MANPNIVNVTTIYGKTVVGTLTTSLNNIVTNTAASGKILKINSLYITNIDGTSAANVSITVGGTYLASTISVPPDATLVIISKDSSIYLEEGIAIQGVASAAGDLSFICSYEEIS